MGAEPVVPAAQVAIMAYTPLEQGRMLGNRALTKSPPGIDATPAQVALACSCARTA